MNQGLGTKKGDRQGTKGLGARMQGQRALSQAQKHPIMVSWCRHVLRCKGHRFGCACTLCMPGRLSHQGDVPFLLPLSSSCPLSLITGNLSLLEKQNKTKRALPSPVNPASQTSCLTVRPWEHTPAWLLTQRLT